MPLSESDRALGREIVASPRDAATFAAVYVGPGDGMDALRWACGDGADDDPLTERPVLERAIFARASTPDELAARAAATARLQSLIDAAAQRQEAVAVALRLFTQRDAIEESAAARRRWGVVAVTVGALSVAAAGAVVAGVMLTPADVPTSTAAPREVATRVNPQADTVVPTSPAPVFDTKPSYGPLPPDDRPLGAPGEIITEQFGLGTQDDLTFYGYGTAQGLVCITVDNALSPDSRASYCVSSETFDLGGVKWDLGGVEIRWLPDGSVEMRTER